jgi:NNP family nitrate/nitrite transporter-like MFS transporter
MSTERETPPRFRPSSILIFSAILLCNVLSRTVFAPLLINIEADLGISHAEGGRLFLFIAIGYSSSMLLSGFVSRALRHRWTIAVAVFASSASLFVISAGNSYALLAVGLVLLGASNGLYIPSGIASVYAVSDRAHWGKAISLHEVGPSIGLVVGPLLAEVATRFASWRAIVAGIGTVYLLVGITYLALRSGARHRGAAPVFSNVRALVGMPRFWIALTFFWLAAAIAIGGYSVMPVYLVSERGLSQTLVNGAIAGSRVIGVLITAGIGFVIDRTDTTKLLSGFWIFAALITVVLGLASGMFVLVAAAVLISAMGGAFPGAFASASRIEDSHLHNVAVSIAIPFGYFLWGGLLPAALGALGEAGMFWLGYASLGALAVAAVAIVALLYSRDARENHS